MRAHLFLGLSLWMVLLLLAVLLGGCADFFFGLAILIQCGPMPMGPSDCYSKRKPTPTQRPTDLPPPYYIDDTPTRPVKRGW